MLAKRAYCLLNFAWLGAFAVFSILQAGGLAAVCCPHTWVCPISDMDLKQSCACVPLQNLCSQSAKARAVLPLLTEPVLLKKPNTVHSCRIVSLVGNSTLTCIVMRAMTQRVHPIPTHTGCCVGEACCGGACAARPDARALQQALQPVGQWCVIDFYYKHTPFSHLADGAQPQRSFVRTHA